MMDEAAARRDLSQYGFTDTDAIIAESRRTGMFSDSAPAQYDVQVILTFNAETDRFSIMAGFAG